MPDWIGYAVALAIGIFLGFVTAILMHWVVGSFIERDAAPLAPIDKIEPRHWTDESLDDEHMGAGV